ncbi:hypothetical protein PsYK624_057330 [Phanerochaete sordida]|uniref:C3H1-type domain-containing protein n=1 Tax=Phanerochaete sordida TaxID=48140 RepID=A0A9P3G926_9APHY|nr:hypothetical protein PsYK624_057330 [Phanerochaete sordida]
MPRHQRARDEDYTRRSMCFNFAQGACVRPACPFSHTLVDPSRLLQLVGDLSAYQAPKGPFETVFVTLEFRVLDGGQGEWTVRLRHVGRVTLAGVRYDVDVTQTRPKVAKASTLLDAIKDLEMQVFGRVASVPWKRGDLQATLCKHATESCEGDGSLCRNNHSLVDPTHLEGLLRQQHEQRRSRGALTSPAFISYLECPRAGRYWRVCEYNSDMLLDFITTGPDFTTTVARYAAYTKGLVDSHARRVSNQPETQMPGGGSQRVPSTAPQDAPPPYSEMAASGLPERSTATRIESPAVPQPSTRLLPLPRQTRNYQSITASSSTSRPGSLSVHTKPPALTVDVTVNSDAGELASSSTVRTSHTVTTPSAAVQVDVGVKTKMKASTTPPGHTPFPGYRVAQPPPAAVNVRVTVNANDTSRPSPTYFSTGSIGASERQPLSVSAATRVVLPAQPPASCAATVGQRTSYTQVSGYGSVYTRTPPMDPHARVQQWRATLPPPVTARPPSTTTQSSKNMDIYGFTGLVVLVTIFLVTTYGHYLTDPELWGRVLEAMTHAVNWTVEMGWGLLRLLVAVALLCLALTPEGLAILATLFCCAAMCFH